MLRRSERSDAAPAAVPEREPLAVGTALKNGAWAIAEYIGASERLLRYKAMGRALRKAFICEYFPLGWNRCGDEFETGEMGLSRSGLEFLLGSFAIARDLTFHPCLARTFDCFEDRQTIYAACEWLEGESLADMIQTRGALSLDLVEGALRDAASALDHIHAQGLLHRDVTPANLWLESGKGARIIDYETISPYPTPRLLNDSIPTTVAYAPLEFMSVFPAYGPQSDVYMLAATAYAALTGRKPTPSAFRVSDPRLPLVHDLRRDLPSQLGLALDRGLRVRAQERPESATALVAEMFD